VNFVYCITPFFLVSDKKMPFSVVCSEYLNSPELCYSMTHKRRGKLIIISNGKFLPVSSMAAYPREGTERDVGNLHSTFTQLGFDIEVHRDQTRSQMLKIFLDGMQLSQNFCWFVIVCL